MRYVKARFRNKLGFIMQRTVKIILFISILGIFHSAHAEMFRIDLNDPDAEKIRRSMEKVKSKAYAKYIKIFDKKSQKEGKIIFSFKFNEKGKVIYYELVESDFENKKFINAIERIILKSKITNVSSGKGVTYMFRFVPEV